MGARAAVPAGTTGATEGGIITSTAVTAGAESAVGTGHPGFAGRAVAAITAGRAIATVAADPAGAMSAAVATFAAAVVGA
jgi:hypothetical protein